MRLKQQGIKSRSLNVSHAFHSPLMEPILHEFEQIAKTLTTRDRASSWCRTLAGNLPMQTLQTPGYWTATHSRSGPFERFRQIS